MSQLTDVSVLYEVHRALVLVTMVVALVIVWKATRAYRQNSDRGMALLAVGLFLLVVAPEMIQLLIVNVIDPRTAEGIYRWRVVEQFFRLTGIATVLASIYVRA